MSTLDNYEKTCSLTMTTLKLLISRGQSTDHCDKTNLSLINFTKSIAHILGVVGVVGCGCISVSDC